MNTEINIGIKALIPDKIKKKLKLFVHKGNKYICPFCNYQSKDLAPIGSNLPIFREKSIIGGGQRKGGCYNCGAIDREKLVYIYLREVAKIFSGSKLIKILHIAPEKKISEKITAHGFNNYLCGDLFTEGYNYLDSVSKIDIKKTQFESNNFDLIICNHVLEHIEEDVVAMAEIYRLVKEGGQAILQVPISKNSIVTYEDFSITNPLKRERVFGQYDHVRIYGQDYEKRLSSVGFKVVRTNISKKFSKYGVNQEEDLFICKK